jgi:hypothetical protein
MGEIVHGPWRAPSLIALVNERKRLDRLIEDTCTERIATLDQKERAPVFHAPSILRPHGGPAGGSPVVFAGKESKPSAHGAWLELD